MSRVGLAPITVPKSAKVKVADGFFEAEGPKGKVRERIIEGVSVRLEDGVITLERSNNSKRNRAFHGLMRALVNNAVVGVSEGFSKQLEIHGVGYRAELQGREVHFALGYSHPVILEIPEGIEIEVEKNTRIVVKGADRQQVGQVAANIRGFRKPDPYKAKGVRYADELIRRKVGKAGAK